MTNNQTNSWGMAAELLEDAKSPFLRGIKKTTLVDYVRKYAHKTGDFTLSSGLSTKHYINMKPIILTGTGLGLISEMILELIDTHCVAGLTLGADPLVSGVAMKGGIAGLIIRKEPKGHGTQSQIEGPLPPLGTKITVLEDVSTTGESALKAVKVLRDNDFVVDTVVSVVDREGGAKQLMEDNGITLKSLCYLSEFV